MYLTYEDLTNGAHQETLNVLQRYQDNALQAILDAMGEVKNYLFLRYKIDEEFSKTGSNRNAFLVKIIRDIAIYNIYCIASPSQMSETRRLKYEDWRDFLSRVAQQKAFIADLPLLDEPASGGNYYVASGTNRRRGNHF
ncbi:MAG: phage protein Gp36 family protein [Synergistales bacterium]|nr:phage protein Gp36 family protein [Bacteroidales bacterium]MDY6434987.1 phage protein Gp36 family protein [Synergistales bacterium]MDY6393409.1 phage protein Gp36 family protein [Bacteroidales bacterium]MDY6395343.1 phage protein Gp36 family protein [Bacteroidales bacterium]MDY6402854.1 phage protein Gp36 family protein [Bacteroidales bacterium]